METDIATENWLVRFCIFWLAQTANPHNPNLGVNRLRAIAYVSVDAAPEVSIIFGESG